MRFLLTGVAALVLSSACLTIAGAADVTVTTAADTVAVSAAASTPIISADPATTTAVDVEAAAPTNGADLAMWGVDNATAQRVLHGNAMRRLANGIIERSTSIAINLTQHALRFLGVPYVFGGTSAYGFDCSGYVQHVFAMLGVHLPRTADAQYDAGRRVAGSMAPGDLVFFTTYESGPSHVGIYLGDGRFVHASSSRGVTVSSLSERYWAARYLGAKRVI